MTSGVTLSDIRRSLRGAVPSVIATASADGTPNITYISAVHLVDDERVALSNQFFSKTSRNLAENPRASVLVLDPLTYDEHRLHVIYERTERRGPVFEALREEVDAVAVLSGMQDVFRLRAADVFRVVDIAQVPPNPAGQIPLGAATLREGAPVLDALSEVAGCIARAADLDMLVDVTLDGLDRLLGYRHTQLLLLDESGSSLYTVASRGFDGGGIGAEIAVGQGQIGLCAERCEAMRVGNLGQMLAYARSVRRVYEQRGGEAPGQEIPLPGLPKAESQVAVPARVLATVASTVPRPTVCTVTAGGSGRRSHAAPPISAADSNSQVSQRRRVFTGRPAE